jgi:Uma2 family endonuclease
MSAPAVRFATYADVLAAPDDKVAEIIDGLLHLSPRPAGRHGSAIGALEDELGLPFKRGRGGPGGWIILIESELHLGGQILVPDLAGWRRERLPKIPDAAFVTVVPDWVCEVLSPRTAKLDRTEKKAAYASEGVAYLWFIDPVLRTLETLQLMEGRWVDVGAFADDARPRAVPFDAIELELGALWADVEPSKEE